MKQINNNHFFFNHKGIKGHAAFPKKPTKKTLEAFYKLIEVASKIKVEKFGIEIK